MKLNRFITGTNVILVILVAIGSFSLSYSALSDLASKNGFTDWRAYILPLVIDIGMLAFGLAVVHAHLHSTNPLRRRLLNLLYTGITVIYNLIHAPSNLTAQGLAIIPPLTLFFTFEVLMAMVEYNIKRSQQINLITSLDTTIANRQSQLSTMDDTIDTLQDKLHTIQQQLDNMNAPKDEVSTRRDKLVTLIHNYKAEFGKPPTQQYLSEQTGVSIGTTRKDMKALNGVVK